MITIRDIYQWRERHKDEPLPPKSSNLTPLQLIEWQKQNSQAIGDYRRKPIEGELLKAAPAFINFIELNKIIANATYRGDYYAIGYEGHTIPHIVNILQVKYEIFYDEFLYEKVKLIHNQSMVELDGKIIDFIGETKAELQNSDYASFDLYYYIKLKLIDIRIIEKEILSAELLDDAFKPKPELKSSNCFIATAAYGNQDITEVIQLREFRENILRNSVAGRCFIFTYSILSPPIALIIRQSNWLRKITRGFLRKVVLPLTKQRTIQ